MKLVVTREDHFCANPQCGKLIPKGTRCMSGRVRDADTGSWKQDPVTGQRLYFHFCPRLSCFLPPDVRQAALDASRVHPVQLSFFPEGHH